MKIDYTNFLSKKRVEHDINKLKFMKNALVFRLKELGLHGHVSCEYYSDGCIKVCIDGNYYNMFDANTGNFFNGYVGD